MTEIYKQLKLRMKELKISNADMAHKINRSPAALSRYLNGHDELDFYNITLLIREMYKDIIEYKEVLKKVIVTLKKPDNIKCAMELASFQEFPEILEEIVNVSANHKNRELNDWAEVYNLHLKFLKKEISAVEMTVSAVRLNVSDEKNELFFFQRWMVAHGKYVDNKFDILPFLSVELGKILTKIQNDYIRKTYSTRLNLMLGNYYLFQNRLDEARDRYVLVLEDSPSLQKKGHALHGLGISYMYENKVKSYENLKEALGIFNLMNHTIFIENVKRTINIISNYHNDDEFYEYDNLVEMTMEKARKCMNDGQIEIAKEMLDSIDVKELNIVNKAFYTLYKGMLHDNIDSLYHSIMYFKQYKNSLYAVLPCKELLKRNEREAAVHAAYGEIVEF